MTMEYTAEDRNPLGDAECKIELVKVDGRYLQHDGHGCIYDVISIRDGVVRYKAGNGMSIAPGSLTLEQAQAFLSIGYWTVWSPADL